MRIGFAVLGLLLLGVGFYDAGSAARMTTTVLGENGQWVYSLELLAVKEAQTTCAIGVAIAGAVLLGAAGVIDAIQAHGRRMAELAEKATPDRQAMLRRLDTLVGNGRAAVPPLPARAAKAAVAAGSDNFDAAIAAELAGPKRK